MVLVAWGWLEHHLSVFSADGEAEVVAGCRKAVHLGLHLLLVTGVEDAVVSKEKVSENSLVGLNSFPSVLNLMLMPRLLSLKASVNIVENIKLNSVGPGHNPV